MHVFHTDRFDLSLPERHRFPMAKYRLLREAIEESGFLPPGSLREAEPATVEQLGRVHSSDYVERVLEGRLEPEAIRRLGFPWSPQLVERSLRSVGATIGACRSALRFGCGASLAGGTHHAFADRGEGFCVFNDVAVAIRELQEGEGVARVVVVDCDVHQGDGTAELFAGDPSVFTLSIHGRDNYPFRKRRSDLDVDLADGAGDPEYLEALEHALAVVETRGRFDLAVYLAGVDPFAGDRLGRLSVSAEGLAARDQQVLAWCRRRGLPTAVVMGGGYASDVTQIVALHLQTVRIAYRESVVRSERRRMRSSCEAAHSLRPDCDLNSG